MVNRQEQADVVSAVGRKALEGIEQRGQADREVRPGRTGSASGHRSILKFQVFDIALEKLAGIKETGHLQTCSSRETEQPGQPEGHLSDPR